jgi:hypothetical protein
MQASCSPPRGRRRVWLTSYSPPLIAERPVP